MPARSVLLSDAIEAYLDWRKTQVKPNTVKNDECWLRQFLAQTGNIYVRSLAPRHVDAFFQFGQDRWGVSSRNLIVTVLKTFFRYCRRHKMLGRDEDPAAEYGTRKVPKVEMLRVPVHDFPRLLNEASHPRDRMLVALGLFLFLRSSEVKEIKIGDVDLDLGEIAVTIPKTDDADVMVINSQLDREMRRYLTWYTETHGVPRAEWLLVPAKNSLHWKHDPQTHRLVPDVDSGHVRLRVTSRMTNPEKIVQLALQKCGYPTYWTGVHTLRRSGARAFYDELSARQGSDSALEIVSAMLHHATQAMTERYLGLSPSRRRRDRVIREAPMYPILEDQGSTVVPLRTGGSHG